MVDKEPAFSISKEQVLLQAPEELSMENVVKFKAQLLSAASEAPGRQVVINLGRTTYIDSSGLSMLVFIKKEMTDRKKNIVLRQVPAKILSVLKLTQLDKIFTIT